MFSALSNRFFLLSKRITMLDRSRTGGDSSNLILVIIIILGVVSSRGMSSILIDAKTSLSLYTMNKFSFRLTSTINEICMERKQTDQVDLLIGIFFCLCCQARQQQQRQILIESDNFFPFSLALIKEHRATHHSSLFLSLFFLS